MHIKKSKCKEDFLLKKSLTSLLLKYRPFIRRSILLELRPHFSKYILITQNIMQKYNKHPYCNLTRRDTDLTIDHRILRHCCAHHSELVTVDVVQRRPTQLYMFPPQNLMGRLRENFPL